MVLMATSESEAMDTCKRMGYRPVSITKQGSVALWFLALGLLAILGGGAAYYKMATSAVSGQVFIVTNGRQNIELGAVQIKYLAEDVYLRARREAVSALKVRAGEIGQKDDDGQAQIYLSDLRSLLLPANTQKILDEIIFDSLVSRTPSAETVKALVNEGKLLKDIFDLGVPADILDKGVVVAKTDSTGKFTAQVPMFGAGRLMARAERDVLGKTETYYWLDVIASGPIQLSNDNLWQ